VRLPRTRRAKSRGTVAQDARTAAQPQRDGRVASLSTTPRLLRHIAAPAARATASSVTASISPPPELPPAELPPEAPLLEPVDVAALAAGIIVTCVDAERAASAADTAVTLTVAGEGTVIGAVYRPAPEIVPTVALPPATPLTCQVTAALLEFLTVAENDSLAETATLALEGLTATVIIGVTVT
jgi:hypothetical protein